MFATPLHATTPTATPVNEEKDVIADTDDDDEESPENNGENEDKSNLDEGLEEDEAEGEEEDDEDDDDDEGVTMSLAAMEEALKPRVMEIFSKIAQVHKKFVKLQELRHESNIG